MFTNKIWRRLWVGTWFTWAGNMVIRRIMHVLNIRILMRANPEFTPPPPSRCFEWYGEGGEGGGGKTEDETD